MAAKPAFIRAKTWRIGRILPGESIELHDRKVALDAAYLAGLDEAERGDVLFRLIHSTADAQRLGFEIIDDRPASNLANDIP